MTQQPDFSKGLLPVILQDSTTKQVLILGYMDKAAYDLSLIHISEPTRRS